MARKRTADAPTAQGAASTRASAAAPSTSPRVTRAMAAARAATDKPSAVRTTRTRAKAAESKMSSKRAPSQAARDARAKRSKKAADPAPEAAEEEREEERPASDDEPNDEAPETITFVPPGGADRQLYRGTWVFGARAKRARALIKMRNKFGIHPENLIDRDLQPMGVDGEPLDPLMWDYKMSRRLTKVVGMCKHPWHLNHYLRIEVLQREVDSEAEEEPAHDGIRARDVEHVLDLLEKKRKAQAEAAAAAEDDE